MATTKKITMKQFNGTDYDTLYPKTVAAQIDGVFPITSGGTGGTTAPVALNNLLNGLSAITPVGNDLFPFKDISGNTAGLVTLANLIAVMGNNGAITTSNLSSQVANLGYSKVQTGSYVGTGTYGISNPTSLTFNFVPKFLMITPVKPKSGDVHYYSVSNGMIGIYNNNSVIQMYGSTSNIINTISGWGTRTLSWYYHDRASAIDASGQMNSSGTTYYWIAIS